MSDEYKHKKQIYELEERLEQNNLTIASSSENPDII
jgi:hypothetical protein